MIVLGVDPDTQATGFALVHMDRGPLAIGVMDHGAKVTGVNAAHAQLALAGQLLQLPVQPDLVVVEYQQHYKETKTNANHLMLLSMITGGVAALFAHTGFRVLTPLPREWKGTVPKGIHQKRILKKLGWDFEDKGKNKPPVPVYPPSLPAKGDVAKGHKEVVDALGLAQWGLTQLDLPTPRPTVL